MASQQPETSNDTPAILFALVIFALSLPGMTVAAPGHRIAMLDMAHREAPVVVHLWYPAADPHADTEFLGRNLMFAGTRVIPDAEPARGPHPVILLSHGSGGSGDKLGWLAGPLAEDGWIVAAPNHPGTTSGDSLPRRTVMPWERTADMRAILDRLAKDAPGKARDGAVAVGFSLGGHTALRLAGARPSKDAFLAYCGRNPGTLDCGWFAANGLDLTRIDARRYEAPDGDERIRAAIAVDPALSAAMMAGSLAAIDIPVLTLSMGAAGTVPEGIDAAPSAAAIPGARHVNVEGGVHFSMLGACRSMGKIVIGLMENEPICTDPIRPRAEVQAEVLREVRTFLEELREAPQNGLMAGK